MKYIFSLLIAFQIAGFLFLIPAPVSAEAQFKNPLDNLQVEIPGLKELSAKYPVSCEEINGQEKCKIPWIGVYISSLYKYLIGIVGILAAVVLMIGGVIWLTAGGNQTRIGEAKAWIGASLTGLIIALTSFMILYQVNPDLVNFKPIKITVVEDNSIVSGSCEILDNETACKGSSGCEWKNNKCSVDASAIKCGLTLSEKDFTAKCCNKGTEYKYAKIPLNQYCKDVCGDGWIDVDSSNCNTNLGY